MSWLTCIAKRHRTYDKISIGSPLNFGIADANAAR